MQVKNLVLGAGIFVVYLLVLNYGIEAFYPSPQYEDYCRGQLRYSEPWPAIEKVGSNQTCSRFPTPQEQTLCNERGGMLVPDTFDAQGCTLTYTCDRCNTEFEEANKAHSQVVFIISLIVGIITLLVGYLILSTEPVGSALMASGIGAFVYGSIRNWQNLSNAWKFILLLFALVLLIWIAYRINRQAQKGFWQKLGLRK